MRLLASTLLLVVLLWLPQSFAWHIEPKSQNHRFYGARGFGKRDSSALLPSSYIWIKLKF